MRCWRCHACKDLYQGRERYKQIQLSEECLLKLGGIVDTNLFYVLINSLSYEFYIVFMLHLCKLHVGLVKPNNTYLKKKTCKKKDLAILFRIFFFSKICTFVKIKKQFLILRTVPVRDLSSAISSWHKSSKKK